ncbi:MAG: GNAT family N-acetyltransferase, partial [Firmicutes bacterium]|nr:GNAT family N-acetyltransferase [Bacillota bacterium]
MRLTETEDYERLVRFFVENELEYDGDEEVDTDILKCFQMTDEEGRLLGAACLARREERYIIDGIAVDAAHRKQKIGEALLEAVIREVRSRGGDS